MFYSHQLLARKAPLGQIWMAATMHAKMNRKKLSRLNLISICEEILNPSVPMALRLSGILMGGVVIVYERKVKLLYDDVTRLLVEINEAWKVKAAPDPTILPKGKSQARKEAVTLPENPVDEDDVGEIEQSVGFSSANATMGAFQRTSYIAMRLDTIDEPYIDSDPREEDISQQLHQADADNIKLFEQFDSHQANADMYNRFERFDVDGDEDTQVNFTSGEHMEIPTTLVPSPTHQQEDADRDQQYKADKSNENVENQVEKEPDECRGARQGQQREGPIKRKARRKPTAALDYEQTIIPGHIYQTWLQSASDIVSRRGRNKRARRDIMSTMKIPNLMELPPVVLIDDFFRTGNGEIPYPTPLMQLWLRSSRPPHDSPSARTSPPLPPEPSVSSPQQGMHHQYGGEYFFDDFQGAGGSESLGIPIERMRANRDNNGVPIEFFMGDLRANLNNGARINETNLVTPGSSGDDLRSIPSSGSGHGFPSHPEANSGRSNKRRPFHSSSRHSSSGLEPVAEESSFPDPNFKLSRLSENDPELIVETGPTQTQRPIIIQPVDKLTDSIRMSMKAHFEMPGAPKIESLNKLTAGMNRKGAALLFYNTCVLASRDCLRVEQKEPYGDIIISKGPKI